MSRLLSLDEVKNLKIGSYQWIEFNFKRYKDICRIVLLKGHVSRNRIEFYNIDWRVWDNKPTDEERKKVSWLSDINSLNSTKVDMYVNKTYIDWIDPKDAYERYNKLFLAYKPGYPLMVVDWYTGEGFRDIRTRDHVEPIKVAEINLPRIDVK